MANLHPRMLFGSFITLLTVAFVGILISPMSHGTKAMVSGGLLVFGFISFYLGVEYGLSQ